jgi:hypothetical protein
MNEKSGLMQKIDYCQCRFWIEGIKNLKNNELNLYLFLSIKIFFEAFLKQGPEQSDKLTINTKKIYADGALGLRGVLLLEDYGN